MADKTNSTLRFTRLRLRNWRNFCDAEVRLQGRGFFVGPNASGKSNLFDALRFLRDLVKPIGGGLGAAVADRGGVSSLRCLQARGTNSRLIEIAADVGTDTTPDLWQYALSFTRKSDEDLATVVKESISLNNEIVASFSRSIIQDEFAASQTLIEQVTQNERFRELALFFSSTRYLHVIPQIVRDPRRMIDRGDDPFGGNLLRQIAETPARTRNARLSRIGEALKIAVPQFVDLRFETDKEGRPHLAAAFKHWRPNPSLQRENLLSDGTLRLIGFLWSIAEKGGPLLLEEPELSLHDDVVEQLPVMIARMQRRSGRQVLISTHSRSLLSDKQIDVSEVHRLVPEEAGTTIETAADNSDVVRLTKAGFGAGEAVMPLARPSSPEQLTFFDVYR